MSKLVEVALTQDGVTENPKGSNSGPEVNEYLKSVGLKPGFSWCMAFVYWCANKAYGTENKLVKTAGVLDQWNKIDYKYKSKTPQVGSIFIMDFGGGKGHTGIVTEVKGSTIYTIEGNSNDEGSREGYEVCRRIRQISSCKGFINIPDKV